MVVDELDGVAELVDDLGDTFSEESLGELELGLVDKLEDVLVSGVLADEVDIVPIVEETVDLGDVGVVHKVVNLNLS